MHGFPFSGWPIFWICTFVYLNLIPNYMIVFSKSLSYLKVYVCFQKYYFSLFIVILLTFLTFYSYIIYLIQFLKFVNFILYIKIYNFSDLFIMT